MIVKTKINVYLLLFAFGLILFESCEKVDDNGITNPTNWRTTAVLNPKLLYGVLTDQEGNKYKTITIGSQTWMAENLRITQYRNGQPILEITDSVAWRKLTKGAYCNYNNTNNLDTIATYGRLYNWYAAYDARNIAPSGWHVATDADWTTLTTALGGESVAAGKLKELGFTHWINPNSGGNNASGFTALPAGNRFSDGRFYDIGYSTNFWSSSPDGDDYAWKRSIEFDSNSVYRSSVVRMFGYSVRCVKD